MTRKILDQRDRVSDLWHKKNSVWWNQENMGFGSEDQYFAFCAAKDWIQDTAEALLLHRKTNFSRDPAKAHLEFWGVMQALFVQQDAIRQLWYSLHRSDVLQPRPSKESAWEELRDLRNLAVGHPTNSAQSKVARADRVTARCVTGRQPKSYAQIPLTIYVAGNVESKPLDLAALIDRYDDEGTFYLEICERKPREQLK